jgi:predicted O-linked N-acetylglucosamine transferase (SPINDLY family)
MNQAVLQNALALRRAGKFAEAAQIYADVLRRDPKHFEALHALGLLRYQCGELGEAERLIAEAIVVNPGAADALYNRGSLLLRLNRLDEALACFDRALAVKPDYGEALGNRGGTLMRLGRHAEALSDFDRLAAWKPGLAEAWNNRGAALMKLGRHPEAHASFSKALAIRPNYPDARKCRAAVSLALKTYSDALADADQVLASNPSNPEAWQLRAGALAELGRQQEALLSYDRALGLNPGSADALYNRANLLLALRRIDEAARDHAQALHIRPDYPYAHGNLAFCKLSLCDWDMVEQAGEEIRTGLRAGQNVCPPFQALAVAASEAEALSAARIWTAREFSPSPEPLWRGEIYRHDRLRVAYLSANYHDHAVARLMAGVFEQHDRTRFETIAVSYGRSDESAMRKRLMGAFDRFIDVQSESTADIAKQLRHMEVDIAVDLMGFTEGCRTGILAFRPAPIQVNYLGYPGTTAADYIDYIIADSVVIPDAQREFYREKVIHLPHCYLPGDSRRAIAQRLPSRSEAGLPERGFVFCCFNNAYKFTPAMFNIWMRLLRNVEGSILWLSQANAGAVRNLKAQAEARGVAPDRLVFAPFVERDEDHLARLSLADLFLDTLPYNAHATGSDALWAGVPLVTIAGASFPGRVGASLLHAIGLPDLIAFSLEAYEELALRLARDSVALAAAKTKLAQNRDTHPLFDTAQFTRDLEAAYLRMWDAR